MLSSWSITRSIFDMIVSPELHHDYDCIPRASISSIYLESHKFSENSSSLFKSPYKSVVFYLSLNDR